MPEFSLSDCHPLVVDDDSDYTRLLARCLERVGVPRSQIRSCVNGEEAIAVLSSEGRIPSFLLLDLHMPRRSGLEVLEWIRSAAPPLSQVLVFMLTSNSDPHHVTRAFELGVGSYFIKPMDVHALERVLEGIVAYWKSPRRPFLIGGNLESRGEGR
jgi:two-component system response regulator